MSIRWTRLLRAAIVIVAVTAAYLVLVFIGFRLATPLARPWHSTEFFPGLGWAINEDLSLQFGTMGAALVALLYVAIAHGFRRRLAVVPLAIVLFVIPVLIFWVPDIPRWFDREIGFDLDDILAGLILGLAGALIAWPLVRGTRWSMRTR